MNDIRPFPGLRFDEELAGALADLICPPYDVISPLEQVELHGRSPHNVVRIELGLEYPEDTPGNNRYTRATATLERWLSEGVLKLDEPAAYLYEQRFDLHGAQMVRLSVVARLRLAPWDSGTVLPHEETMSGPKLDRLRLMRATACNLSPLFLLFDDPSGEARQAMDAVALLPPWEVAQTEDGQEHRLWVVRGDMAEQLVDLLKTPQLFMADGHHRYETALAYRDEMMAADPSLGDDAGVNFVMALMVDAKDPGLVILPTHRVIGGVDERRMAALLSGLEERFVVEQMEAGGTAAERAQALVDRMRSEGVDRTVLGLCTRQGVRLLSLKGGADATAGNGRPVLDVDVLHDLVLGPLLGIGEEALRAEEFMTYTRDAVEAIEAVGDGSAQAAFLLNPTRVGQVLDTARAGSRMPRKSTYFYPKPMTGLVINPLWA